MVTTTTKLKKEGSYNFIYYYTDIFRYIQFDFCYYLGKTYGYVQAKN